MRRERIFLSILIFILVLLFLTHPIGVSLLGRTLFTKSGAADDSVNALQAENESLKAELARLEAVQAELPAPSKGLRRAEVYSRYPFGLKSELLIGTGERDGILLDQAVVSSGALIGKITNVFKETSLVQTIFDERWQSAVRVGHSGADALLVGGAQPKLTLIIKNASVKIGDVIYNAAPPFPIGLAIGEVKALSLSRDGLFNEAAVGVPYDVSRLRVISIFTGE